MFPCSGLKPPTVSSPACARCRLGQPVRRLRHNYGYASVQRQLLRIPPKKLSLPLLLYKSTVTLSRWGDKGIRNVNVTLIYPTHHPQRCSLTRINTSERGSGSGDRHPPISHSGPGKTVRLIQADLPIINLLSALASAKHRWRT